MQNKALTDDNSYDSGPAGIDNTGYNRSLFSSEDDPNYEGSGLLPFPDKIFTLLNIEERRTRVQYRPDGLLLFNPAGRDHAEIKADKELSDELKQQLQEARKIRFQGGELSPGARRNLVRGFDNLLMISKRSLQFNQYIKKAVPFQLAMITLTLPTDRILSSKEMNKRLLKRFLQWLEDYSQRHYRKKLFYIWKLELQERGQLHWHIILNRFISYEVVAKQWSYLLKDTGLSRDYYKKYGSHEVKPATRTESVKRNTSGEMRAYILKKYLKKPTDKAVKEAKKKARVNCRDREQLKLQLENFDKILSQIDGGCWGCSQALREKYPTVEIDFPTYLRMKDDSRANPGNYRSFEFCMMISDKDGKPPDLLLSQKFKAIIRANRDFVAMGGARELKKFV